jgi:hypothetical protein
VAFIGRSYPESGRGKGSGRVFGYYGHTPRAEELGEREIRHVTVLFANLGRIRIVPQPDHRRRPRSLHPRSRRRSGGWRSGTTERSCRFGRALRPAVSSSFPSYAVYECVSRDAYRAADRL